MPLITEPDVATKEGAALIDSVTLAKKTAATRAACLFHSFSDISRTRIVQHLLNGEHNVKQLTELLGLAQTTVSGHLACLLDCGVVQRRPVGRSSMYSLTHPQQTLALLQAAQDLLLATGQAVTLCPEHGIAILEGEAEEMK